MGSGGLGTGMPEAAGAGVFAPAGAGLDTGWPVEKTGGWYDLKVTCAEDPAFSRRYAGRVETGKPSISDPAMAGPALMTWTT